MYPQQKEPLLKSKLNQAGYTTLYKKDLTRIASSFPSDTCSPRTKSIPLNYNILYAFYAGLVALTSEEFAAAALVVAASVFPLATGVN